MTSGSPNGMLFSKMQDRGRENGKWAEFLGESIVEINFRRLMTDQGLGRAECRRIAWHERHKIIWWAMRPLERLVLTRKYSYLRIECVESGLQVPDDSPGLASLNNMNVMSVLWK